MTENPDRLYELLPAVYRQRDSERGWPLKALLRVIAEQMDFVQADIAQLYDNWFIETCDDWVVPYIGDLIGYRPVHDAHELQDVSTDRGRQRARFLIPRREVANTIRYRRQKGTLALLEMLANDVAGWPARAVEFYRLLGVTQATKYPRLGQGRTVDLRRGDALGRIGGPFDELAHTVDVRRIDSHRTTGRYNIPSVGVFVWRLKAYSVTQTPAYCLEAVNPNCYTFSVLGNDSPLYTRPQPEKLPTDIAGELNVPVPVRRRALIPEERLLNYYGKDKSFHIWTGDGSNDAEQEPVEANRLVVADLKNWAYRPNSGKVAIDPIRGRIAFPPRKLPKSVWVTYHYGFPADIGGGEYDRDLSQPAGAVMYRVGKGAFDSIDKALEEWGRVKPPDAVIEITESSVYVEQIRIKLNRGQSLQLRAAKNKRPVIRLLDMKTAGADYLNVEGGVGSRFTIDGLLVMGRGVKVEGPLMSFTVRHSTLVPGWTLGPECEAARPTEPSLTIVDTKACITIDHSIVGSIQVNQDEVKTDPIEIRIRDSVLDATDSDVEALGAPGWPHAHAAITFLRSTVIGYLQTHAIELAENSIFVGRVSVARRRRGCMRFCYVTPGSRTPRLYNCQPDLAEKPILAQFRQREISREDRDRTIARERIRVRPEFTSTRYGTPAYCQLANDCADEIKHGADDQSEMGVFHDLYQPQRAANLRARLDEYTPAGMQSGIIYSS